VDFDFDENQSAILDGLEQLITGLQIEAPKDGIAWAWSPVLDQELTKSGFLDIAREEGFTLLEAALFVERIARLPVAVEVAASALIAPLFAKEEIERPLALTKGNGLAPVRFLPQARSLLIDRGDDLLLVAVDPARVRPIESLFAYPYGRLDSLEGLPSRAVGAELLPDVRRRWRLSVAVEAAGLMQSAVDTVVEHVTSRYQFGRPLGSFQAIQHRLALAAGATQAARWLALRAAWSDGEEDCAVALTYVQDAIPTLVYDLHQFCGAMGLTLEFPLHFWTYRLKAILGELGGGSAQARAAAQFAWPAAA
jgi:hypothetical protein